MSAYQEPNTATRNTAAIRDRHISSVRAGLCRHTMPYSRRRASRERSARQMTGHHSRKRVIRACRRSGNGRGATKAAPGMSATAPTMDAPSARVNRKMVISSLRVLVRFGIPAVLVETGTCVDMDRVENGSEVDLHGILRERLVFMRGDLIERLAKGGIDGGMLALLGSVGAAIAAIDAVSARS